MNMEYLTVNEKAAIEKFASRLEDALGDNLVSMRLFGSRIRGDFSPESDIDILLVVKNYNIEVEKKISDILFDIDPYYDFKISPVVYSELEYKKNEEMESPFIENLKREGVNL